MRNHFGEDLRITTPKSHQATSSVMMYICSSDLKVRLLRDLKGPDHATRCPSRPLPTDHWLENFSKPACHDPFVLSISLPCRASAGRLPGLEVGLKISSSNPCQGADGNGAVLVAGDAFCPGSALPWQGHCRLYLRSSNLLLAANADVVTSPC